ncbi:NAD(P)H-dependent oxidoreductase [Streptomyces sp. 4N124]|uniref:NAD(P)H-dependent oxidoreductase n=1 Tax=Streptomyces sp. 4N124 TaxID=3457420 RepID=UPI003FCFB1A8
MEPVHVEIGRARTGREESSYEETERPANGRTRRVLGICGSPKVGRESASEYLCGQALKGAEELGAETRLVRLVDFPVVDCDGCGDCMNSKQCHLFKRPEDQYTRLFRHIRWADAFIFASPVYALGLPFTWKQWLDRCEPADEDDLDYQYYNYEVAADVKGKAFQGKVAGQIVTSGGIGQEWAMAQLMPLWTNVKLSVVVSVGLSLIEFDEQPGIREKPWGQGVREADFAVEIARQVGRRVTSAIGFSTFNLPGASPRVGSVTGRDVTEELSGLQGLDDRPFDLAVEQDRADPLVLVLAGQEKSEEAARRLATMAKLAPGLDLRLVAAVDRLPPFVSRDFVKGRISDQNHPVPVLLDWERAFADSLGLPPNVEPHTLVVDRAGRLLRAMKGTYTTREVLAEVQALSRDATATPLPQP